MFNKEWIQNKNSSFTVHKTVHSNEKSEKD